ncbi:hypothetical protein JI59_17735 [Novosphingobium pentaromativorans US6-1]|uniref:CoA transferase n=1 Tax=Novosphingobium pentaromativorans US6-1 TaxID=1088721 RepID=G6E801_9SPHN|nr:hypothetical protein JI59_17735 [Novosphingobium pentaromativorans US6-1]EHJ62644.1 hypothetical protein NSU_0472 [Novosphingobium pentaromativorans US6-1]
MEIGNELGEYCGKLLAGLGADVIRVEPPEGEETRNYGPFLDDEPGRERSLYFWHYNFGKRGITLDLDMPDDQSRFLQLARTADVVIDSRPRGWLDARGIGGEALRSANPRLIYSRISPFGDTGPWADYEASDLVHLALGGVMNNCGYDPDSSGFYETPPIAPQMWQSYHIAGEMAAMAILAALNYRSRSGEGQSLSTSVHTAVAQATERDIPSWIYLAQDHMRMTCRHSSPIRSAPILAPTKDGRFMFPYRSYAHSGDGLKKTIDVLAGYGMEEDLLDPKYSDPAYTANKHVEQHVADVVGRFVQRFMFDRDVWRDFQAVGLTWAPVRLPHENVADEHWQTRETFLEVERPELGRSFTDVGARWMCPEVPWRTGPRSPLLGEHNDAILGALDASTKALPATPAPPQPENASTGESEKPFALDGLRFIDLGWLVASSGAGRFLSAFGMEVAKIEHSTRWDGMRHPLVIVGEDGREKRDAATGPLPDNRTRSPNRSGLFMDINAGKRSIGLNLKDPRGKAILAELIAIGDVVGEGFSPGTMERMGFGYERLKEINPKIVYVQQSGMGQIGTYGEMRSYGPVAQAFSGISEMSGLPQPFPPAGIGYSYLDWFAAYNQANAILAALYRRNETGKGCWIDASQVEVGIYLNGTTILDYSANGRAWERYGNRSPYKPAAPSGAFRAAGTDRWVAISCFTEDQWRAFVEVLGSPAWASEGRFATLESRLHNQASLEALVNSVTGKLAPYDLMEKLQRAGVPAGVCQTAADRCDTDPQLKASPGWMVELPQSEIGSWRTKGFPVELDTTPVRTGGVPRRHGPNYAEDNEFIYGEWLGYSTTKIEELREAGVI